MLSFVLLTNIWNINEMNESMIRIQKLEIKILKAEFILRCNSLY